MFETQKKDIRKYNNIGIDIETYGDDNKFYMGSLFFSEAEKHIFYNKSEFINFFIDNSSKFKHARIWAHNLGFDFNGLFWKSPYFSEFKIMLRGADFIAAKSYIYDDRFNFYTSQNHHQQPLVFADTMSFFKGSLKKIGNFIKIPKLDKPEFLGKKPKTEAERQYLELYNINDSRITKNFADFLQKTYNTYGAELKLTLASTAMDLFKRKYLGNRRYFIPNIPDLDSMFKCMYGGRTEVFNRGHTTEKLKVYDYNSLYPSVMDKMLYPNVNNIHHSLLVSKRLIYEYEGFCYAELEYTEKIKIPFLQQRINNKLIFPTGKIKGYYTFIELRKALELGYRLMRLFDGVYFTNTDNFFGDFVPDLYAIRSKLKADNDPMELPVKLAMNGLFGKFSQKLEQQEIKHFSKLTVTEYERANKIRNSDYYRFMTKKEQRQISFIMPIISAYVTAYARIKLFDAISPIQDNVFYIDTDSIFTTKTLPTSLKLGELKLEYKTKEAFLIKPKFYAVVDDNDKIKIKIKGAHLTTQSISSFMDIVKNKNYSYTQFSKFRSSLVQDIDPNTKQIINKVFSFEDNKRDWGCMAFSIKDFQDSKPLNTNTLDKEKLAIYERKAYNSWRLQQQKELDVYLNSNLFDSAAVGSDISKEEFLENEKFFVVND